MAPSEIDILGNENDSIDVFDFVGKCEYLKT